MKTELSKIRREAYTITGFLLTSYGFLLCVTNRTLRYLFIKSVSFTRLGQGILLVSLGLLFLTLAYGVKEETDTPRRRR